MSKSRDYDSDSDPESIPDEEASDTTLKAIRRIELRQERMSAKIQIIEERITPIIRIVYGAVTIIVAAVFTAMVYLVVQK